MLGIFITQTLVFLCAMLGILMQYKYSDKRTKVFKKLRNTFIIITLIVYPVGLFVAWQDHSDAQNQILRVNSNLDSVKHRLDTSNSSLNFTKNQLKILDSRSIKLDSQLMPFLNLATRKFPQLSPDSALDKLRVTIINNTYINNGSTKRVLKNSNSIIEALQRQPKGAYQLFYLTSDAETSDLAIEINSMLVKAGWTTIPPNLLISKPGLKGVTIYISKEKEPMITFANSLSQALGNKGVGVSVVTENKLTDISLDWNSVDVTLRDLPTALIFIGTNPE